MMKRILIVDDDTTVTKFLSPLFAKRNYHAVVVEDGKTALENINVEKPDLILSDITMPGMDGYEFFRKVRENPKTAVTPFIFMTGRTAPSDELKGLRMGVDEYLTKPIDLRTLFGTIENVLTKTKMQQVDFSGSLETLNFEDIVQMIEMNQKSGELIFTIKKDQVVGTIYFKNGKVIHAVTDNLEGEEAIYDLMARKEGYVRFFGNEINVDEKITGNTMSMLLEAARMQDEGKALYSMICDIDAPLCIKSRKISSKITETLGNEWISNIFSMVEKNFTVAQVVNSCAMSRPRAECILAELIKAGIVQLKNKEEKYIEEPVILLAENIKQDDIQAGPEKKMKSFPVHIITDSSVDLPSDCIKNNNITIMPRYIQFGRQVYLVGVNIAPDHFYAIMENSPKAPVTFPVSDDEFFDVFTKIAVDKDILGIFMSKKLNKTYANALYAKDSGYKIIQNRREEKYISSEMPKIEIVDSKLVSSAMGLLVMEAMEKIRTGWPLEKIRTHIEQLIPKVRVIFLTKNISNLKHNWQIENIGKTGRNTKQIIGIKNGKGNLEMFGQVRSSGEAQQIIERLIREDLLKHLGATPIKAAVMHSDRSGWADEISQMLLDRFKCRDILRTQIGPIVGAHLGMGVVGIAYYPIFNILN